MRLLDGKKQASLLLQSLKEDISSLSSKPHLAFLLVGEHAPSKSYVTAKQKACQSTGILSTLIALPCSVSQQQIEEKIEELNQNHAIDGILIQLPLPPHIDTWKITSLIDPSKDVDGFHPINLGKLLLGIDGGFCPCTPLGIQTLLEKESIPTEGKHVVILGRSHIVGKPLAALLMQKKPSANATVTIAHSGSSHLEEITRSADILISAIGKPLFVSSKMVRKGACVIDVGINRLPNGKLVGDVDFDAVAPLSSAITPVPGGIGPMTIALLLKNTFLSYNQRRRFRC